MVGVEVAEDDGVGGRGEIEDGGDVEAISSCAGGGRRNITIEDLKGGVADGEVDADDFKVLVVGAKSGDVDMLEADGVVD